jgi:dsRNA-specific ribonuclease
MTLLLFPQSSNSINHNSPSTNLSSTSPTHYNYFIHTERIKRLNNENLSRLATIMNFRPYIRSEPMINKLHNILFPSSSQTTENSNGQLRNKRTANDLPPLRSFKGIDGAFAEQKAPLPAFSKVQADVLEALFGIVAASTSLNQHFAEKNTTLKDIQLAFELCHFFQLCSAEEYHTLFPTIPSTDMRFDYPHPNCASLHPTYNQSIIQAFEEHLGYSYRKKEYAIYTLTHSALHSPRPAVETHTTASYETQERFQSLGNALYEYLVADYLYHTLPHHQAMEGVLSSGKNYFTEESRLASTLRSTIPHLLSNGHLQHQPNMTEKMICATFFAILGSVYYDSEGDMKMVMKLIEQWQVLSLPNQKETLLDTLTAYQDHVITLNPNYKPSHPLQ